MTILHARCGNCEGRPDEDRAHCDWWHDAATAMMAACVKLVDYADTRQPDFIVISAQLTKAIELARDALVKANAQI